MYIIHLPYLVYITYPTNNQGALSGDEQTKIFLLGNSADFDVANISIDPEKISLLKFRADNMKVVGNASANAAPH